MAVNVEYRDFVLEQLSYIASVRWCNMFGGVGLWSDELFFAIIVGDVLYLKVDETNLADFTERGMDRFEYMNYYAVPEDVLDDPGELRGWVEKAKSVARRSRRR